LEIYSEARYFTVTGNVFGSARTIESSTEELQAVHDKFFPPDTPQITVTFQPVMSAPSAVSDK
jgi:primase-polymerase (primpol)-like protein